jgi:hypothetical protein
MWERRLCSTLGLLGWSVTARAAPWAGGALCMMWGCMQTGGKGAAEGISTGAVGGAVGFGAGAGEREGQGEGGGGWEHSRHDPPIITSPDGQRDSEQHRVRARGAADTGVCVCVCVCECLCVCVCLCVCGCVCEPCVEVYY